MLILYPLNNLYLHIDNLFSISIYIYDIIPALN